MKSELEKLAEKLLVPCERLAKTWDFDGQIYNVEITASDLVDERTWCSYRVILSFKNCYKPKVFENFLVHNEEVAALLAGASNASGLEHLYEVASDKELFVPKLDEHGLVVTSTSSENRAMNINRWITDSIHNLALVEDEKKGIIIRLLAKFYCTPTEQVAFRRIIENPWLYRNSNDAREGVAHIFQVNEIEGELHLQRDPTWFNNKRLESHGLALRTFCDFLTGRLAEGSRNPVEDEVCTAVASLALYFQAIDYPTAPSVGAWEEVPFPGGLSWDTEAIRQGFCALQRLMFTVTDDFVEAYRKAICQSARHLSILAGRNGSDALFTEPKILARLIEIGTGQIRLRVRQRAEAPGMRNRDASLAFLAQSELELVETEDEYECILETVRLYKALLDDLEIGLVRKSGMIRYEPFSREPNKEKEFFDSYLTVNYWLGFDESGYFNPVRMRLIKEFQSSDASEPETLKKRTKLGISEREAEWFLVTEMARGYAKQAQRLRNLLGREIPQAQRQEAQALFDKCKAKACEYVMRGYGRITPEIQGDNPATVIKSNGESCLPWQLPEAYEWVRICAKALNQGNNFVERTLPGVNTSLAWAASSLKMATEETLKLLWSEEI